MEPDLVDTVLRMGAAVVVGVIVGTNRDLAGKPIGMRTLGLVSLGAAVVSSGDYPSSTSSPDTQTP